MQLGSGQKYEQDRRGENKSQGGKYPEALKEKKKMRKWEGREK